MEPSSETPLRFATYLHDLQTEARCLSAGDASLLNVPHSPHISDLASPSNAQKRLRQNVQRVLRSEKALSGFYIGDARSFLTSTSKFNIEANGGIFDVNPQNDRASPNVETPSGTTALLTKAQPPFSNSLSTDQQTVHALSLRFPPHKRSPTPDPFATSNQFESLSLLCAIFKLQTRDQFVLFWLIPKFQSYLPPFNGKSILTSLNSPPLFHRC